MSPPHILYYAPRSPYCRKTLWGLYEKEVAFETERVDIDDAAAHGAFRKKRNPLGRVPILYREGRWPIPESSIILEWADAHHEGPERLIPEDTDAARRTRYNDRAGDLYLIAPALRMAVDRPGGATAAVRDMEDVHTCLRVYDSVLRTQPFLMGAAFSLADIAPAVAVDLLLQQALDLEAYPQLLAWHARMRARPAYARMCDEIA